MSRFLQDLLTNQVGARAERVAICWKDERIPYGEFDRITNQLAQMLRIHGCRPGDRVVVMIPNSPNALFAVLGILKAGCVAVPVDVTMPAIRTAKILDDYRPSVVLAARAARSSLDELFATHVLGNHAFAGISIGTLEALPIEGKHFSTAFNGINVLRTNSEPLVCHATPNSPAIFFTCASEMASTVIDLGGSNNVEAVAHIANGYHPTSVTHAEVLNFVDELLVDSALFEFDRAAAWPLGSPVSFAMSFAAISAGAELHITPPEFLSNPRQLATFIRSHELTDWLTTFGTVAELIRHDAIQDGDFPSLKRLLWVGDRLPTAMLKELTTRLPLVQFARTTGTPIQKLTERTIERQLLQELESDSAVEPIREVVRVQ